MELCLNFVKKICPYSQVQNLRVSTSSGPLLIGSTSNGLSFSVFDSIRDLDKDSWDKLVHGKSIFLSRPYLEALANNQDESLGIWYVIFHQNNQDVGAAVFQAVDFQTRPLGQTLEDGNVVVGLVAHHLGLKNKPLSYRLLVCGNCFATGEHGFTFEDGISHDYAVDALGDAARTLQKSVHGEQKFSGILFKDFYPETQPMARKLNGHSYTEFPSEAGLILNLDPDWKNFEDYLDSLLSKFRVKAKRAYTKSEALTVRDLNLSDLREHRQTIHTLYHNVADRADFRMGKLEPNVFEQLRENMGSEFVIKGYFLEDKLVGFMSGFEVGKSLEAHLVGIDYEHNQEHSIYPRMLYDYIEVALERGVNSINYGRTAGEIKSTVGAEPVALTCYLRHRSSASNHLVKLVSRFIRPDEFPVRQPFKKEWYDKMNGQG